MLSSRLLLRHIWGENRQHIKCAIRRCSTPAESKVKQEHLYQYLKDRAYDFKSKKLRYECANILKMARDMSEYELAVDTTEFRFAHSPEDKEKVRRYMIETFYREAPLPGKALNMTDTLQEDDYLIREIDNMLNAGLGQLYHVVDSGEFIGAGVHAAWKPDPNYNAFETTAIEWLNTGARIAQEKTENPHLRSIMFRDFQYQLIYHYGQKLARERKKDLIIYAGGSFIEPRFRTGKTTEWLFSFLSMALQHNALFYFVGTIPKFERNILGNFGDVATIFDVANFRDLKLELEEGKNTFEPLKNSDGLVFVYANS